MVEYQHQALDRTLAALADPTRRAIIERLRHGEARVTELAEPFNMSLNAISKHLQVLERAGLMRRTVRGREHHCALQGAPMREVTAWIERYRLFWEEQLDSLEEYLLRNTKPVKKPRGKK